MALTREQWGEVRATFDALVDLPPPTREMRLTGVDPAIAAEVRRLLKADQTAGVLDAPLWQEESAAEGYSSLSAGAMIGSFRIDRLIGRGGMGEVYLAERSDHGFDQRVALKMLRPEAVARGPLFEAERRLLAGLEHPGIARLIDGGAAPDGRSWMALEYVDGMPIDAWCAAHKADLAARLKLFLEVSEAVAYAHARLVIHQDIKPSNVLVDGDGRVRLLDFGVARLVEDVTGDRTATMALMTPEYAAPEQFEQRAPTVATDIYSLGALLFELLVGRGPWRFEGASLPTALHRLLYEDAPVPSKMAASEPSPPVQAKALTGDLDAIVLKAMRRQPGERYATVEELAADIRRHLAFEPVVARRGTGSYVARRFVRRHRWGVAASAAGVLALIAGASGFAWQAHRVTVQRDIAEAQSRHAEAVNRAVTLMFADASDRGLGGDATAEQMLDDSSKSLVATLDPNAPDSTAVVRAIAELYGEIQKPAGAIDLTQRAIEKGIGRNDPIELAELEQLQGVNLTAMSQFDKAKPLLAAAGRVWASDPERFRTERLEAIAAEAQMRRLQGDRDGAIKLLMASLPEAEQAYADNPRELMTHYADISIHLIEANRLDEADAVMKRGEAAAKRLNQENTAPALTLLQMRAAWMTRKGDVAGAVPLFRKLVDGERTLYGPSAGLAISELSLGRTLLGLKKSNEALAVLDEAEPMMRQYLGPVSQGMVMVEVSRAPALASLGRQDEAEKALAAAQPGLVVAGKDNVMYLAYLTAHAIVRMKQGRFAESGADLDAAEKLGKALGDQAAPFLANLPPIRAQLEAAQAT